MTKESSLWNWLSKVRPVYREKLHMTRLENLVGEGTPDVDGCLEGCQFWAELKCNKRPARAKTPIRVKFRPMQVPWLKRRVRADGRAFVLVQVGQGRAARRYLIPGEMAAKVATGLTEAELDGLAVCDPEATATEIVQTAAGARAFTSV